MKLLRHLFEQRIRGFRLIEIVTAALAFGLVFWVYLSTVREGKDVRRLNDLDRQIEAEREAVQSLRLKVANLERPSRLEALATEHLGMKPPKPSHEAGMEALDQLASDAVPAQAATSSTAPPPPPPPPVATAAAVPPSGGPTP